MKSQFPSLTPHGAWTIARAVLGVLVILNFSLADSYQNVEALVYPDAMHNRKLASGEVFRQERLTAGHGTIPLGTVVRVSNAANGRSIDVLITDRWEGNQNNIILSQSAASLIGLSKEGTGRVNVTSLNHPVVSGQTAKTVSAPAPAPVDQQPTQNPAAGLYFLEFASYKNIVQAKLLANKLTKRGAPSRVAKDLNGMFHVISDGFFTSLEEASQAYYLVNDNVGYTAKIKQI